MQNPKSSLGAFGLTEKEAAVYAASLELGAATADQLANQSGIKRSTTYLQIEQLQEKGLMSTFEQGKKTLFTPESPENLERLLEKQKKDIELKQDILKKELPQLSQLFDSAGERPVVRFYQGREGIVSLREETLKARDKKLLVISSNDDLKKVLTEEEMDSFSEKRTNLGISMRLLYTRTSGKFTEASREKTNRAYIDSKKLELGTDMVIYDDNVAMMTLKGSLVGVLIQSKELSKSMRSIYEILWSQAEKH
jgi:sugar-specific transcriptional regulator TrmB